MGTLRLAVVDAGGPVATAAMTRYFDELIARLPGGFDAAEAFVGARTAFNPPSGRFVVASLDRRTVGCGAIQFLDASTAEIKRMWVDPTTRGNGVGRRLLAELEQQARRAGCARAVLDTNATLVEAIALYRSAGYVDAADYNDNPDADHWFEKPLGTD